MAKLKAKIGSGEVGRFDQRNTMYTRPRDPERSDERILDIGKRHYAVKRMLASRGAIRRSEDPFLAADLRKDLNSDWLPTLKPCGKNRS